MVTFGSDLTETRSPQVDHEARARFAAAQASIVNAVNDALRPFKVGLNVLPLTPPRVLAAIRDATLTVGAVG